MAEYMDCILDALPAHCQTLSRVREIFLANAVLTGEIPAPTFGEENRIRFVSDRFTESGLQNISVDETNSCIAVLPGKNTDKNILVCAHADTIFSSASDHTVTVKADCLTGPGIADNSLGIATVITLPEILSALGVAFESNIVLLAASRSLGRGDLGGLRFFLDNINMPFRAGICVEGAHLGRLSYECLGMARGEITIKVPAEIDWTRYGSRGAVVIVNKILSKILAIPVPENPKTSVILGSVNAGTTFNTMPTNATLRFEIRSEQAGVVGGIVDNLADIVNEVSAETATEINFEILARRNPGGISLDHPLVASTRAIMDRLGIKPHIAPNVGGISALIAKNIPAITLGITQGSNLHEVNETIAIEPLFQGLTQLVAVLSAIDGGICDED